MLTEERKRSVEETIGKRGETREGSIGSDRCTRTESKDVESDACSEG